MNKKFKLIAILIMLSCTQFTQTFDKTARSSWFSYLTPSWLKIDTANSSISKEAAFYATVSVVSIAVIVAAVSIYKFYKQKKSSTINTQTDDIFMPINERNELEERLRISNNEHEQLQERLRRSNEDADTRHQELLGQLHQSEQEKNLAYANLAHVQEAQDQAHQQHLTDQELICQSREQANIKHQEYLQSLHQSEQEKNDAHANLARMQNAQNQATQQHFADKELICQSREQAHMMHEDHVQHSNIAILNLNESIDRKDATINFIENSLTLSQDEFNVKLQQNKIELLNAESKLIRIQDELAQIKQFSNKVNDEFRAAQEQSKKYTINKQNDFDLQQAVINNLEQNRNEMQNKIDELTTQAHIITDNYEQAQSNLSITQTSLDANKILKLELIEEANMAYEEFLQQKNELAVHKQKSNYYENKLATKYSQEADNFTNLNNSQINPFLNDNDGVPALYKKVPAYFEAELDRLIQSSEPIMIEIENKNLNKSITRQTICPKSGAITQTIIIKLVHGTKLNTNHIKFDPHFIEAIRIFAKQLAIKHNAIVYFDDFRWNGGINAINRETAGMDLANEIKNNTEMCSNATIWTIGHSHGCNVIHHAAEKLKAHSIKIDHAIFLASPEPDKVLKSENAIDYYNIQSILNFWGAADFTGKAGSAITTIGNSTSMRRKSSPDKNEIVRNIVLKKNGKDLNHGSIQIPAMQFLAGIMQYIGNNFLIPSNLIINVYDPTISPSSSPATINSIASTNSASASAATSTSSSPMNKKTSENILDDYDLCTDDNECFDKNNQIDMMQALETQWVVEGVIDNAEPLKVVFNNVGYLQNNLSQLLSKSIALSNKNEFSFSQKYKNNSIHTEPTIWNNLCNEVGPRLFGNVQIFGNA